MRFAAQLPDRLDHLGDAAAIGRMAVAKAAAVGVEGKLADPGDQITVGDETPALALLAKAKIFDLHQHGDGETIVDRGILDVGRLHSRLLERAGSGPRRAREGQIDLPVELALDRLARAENVDDRPLERTWERGASGEHRAAPVG